MLEINVFLLFRAEHFSEGPTAKVKVFKEKKFFHKVLSIVQQKRDIRRALEFQLAEILAKWLLI